MEKKLNNDLILESVLKVGVVNEVKGKNVVIKVDKQKNAPHLLFRGQIIKNVSVGSYIKISKGFNEIIGKIDGEYISEDKNAESTNYKSYKNRIRRFLNISLVGFMEDGVFKQGLKELPLIENECFLLTQIEFDCIHSFAREDQDKIKIGTLLNETSVEIKLGVDKLFASHIGIFGNTGSGKSYSLAKIYHELLAKYVENEKFKKNAKFLLIDFNGEYALNKVNDNIITEEKSKQRFFLSTSKDDGDKFPIPESEVNDLTFWAILLKATDQTQKPFLDSSLTKKYLIDYTKTAEGLKALIFNNLKLILTQASKGLEKDFHIYFLDELTKVNSGENMIFSNIKSVKDNLRNNLTIEFANYKLYEYDYSKNPTKFIEVLQSLVSSLEIKIENITLFTKIRLQIILNYFYVILKGFYSREHIGPLYNRVESKFNQITKVFRISNDIFVDSDKPLTIISLNDVNVEMKKIIPLVVCKYFYEYFKKNNLTRDQYLNIIVDEAHNILSRNSIRESETWKDYRLETFEEIIKEGRKFGVFLTISSQRPSDISDTIISQLHNYFLHRLINNKDIEAIGRTVSYLDRISFESLSILPQGSCILAGLSADLPVVLKIDKLLENYKPHNETIELTKHWM
jgi:DNA helicase HerA-like ATPase